MNDNGNDRAAWTTDELELLSGLSCPGRIQAFLDETAYSTDDWYRCPRRVLRERRAHCVDGAVFAAAALRMLGHQPLVVDLRAERDDDHFIAVFRNGRHLGAVAKSNTVGLRFREPIYRTLRELVMSYFEFYFNLDGEKTLRSFSPLVDLSRFDALAWTWRDDAIETLVTASERARHTKAVAVEMIPSLRPVDERLLRAGFLGADWDGLYKPSGQPGP